MNNHEIKQTAGKNGLDIREETIKRNDSGVDFQVVHSEDADGQKWILRIPRRPESMRHAGREKQALDIISRHVSFEVPEWSVFSEDLIAYRELSGTPAAVIDMEKQDYVWSFDKNSVPDNYYSSLGKNLAELHSLPMENLQVPGIKDIEAAQLQKVMSKRMEKVSGKYQVNQHLWNRWQVWLHDTSSWPDDTAVTHGDLHPGHLLLNNSHQVTGMIDWTEVGTGDVSVDFMSHLLLFGEEGLARVIAAYEAGGGKTWPKMEAHVKGLLTTSGITVAEYAEVSGLKEMEETAARMLADENGGIG